MKWLENFIALVRQYYRPAHPTRIDLGTFDTSQDIAPLIADAWGYGVFGENKIKTLSGEYKATTIDSLLRFVKHCKIDELDYVEPFHNCPDFAMGLLGKLTNTKQWWGTAFGYLCIMTPVGWHAINIAFAYPDKDDLTCTMYFIEPQDARLLTYSEIPALDLILLP